MSRVSKFGRQSIALFLVVVILLGSATGVAAAETRTGGEVVVGPDKTVSGLTAFGGSVIVRGTVQGDLTAFAGNVIIESGGQVTGDVEAFAGNVQIDGTVGGSVSATGGNIVVGNTASIGGPLEIAAGTITVAGTVSDNAKLAGGAITLAPSALIEGDLEYSVGEDGSFEPTSSTVTGNTTEREDLSIGGGFNMDIPDFGGPIFGIYGFLVNVVVGALLLLIFPRSTDRVAGLVKDSPLQTGGIGFLTLIGVPIGLVIVAITIVGIPLSLAGLLAYLLAVWIGTIYGRYAVGVLLLDYTEIENRWAELATGLVVVALLARIPWLGGIFELLVLLLGLGAIATLLYRFIRGQRETGGEESVDDAIPA